MIRKVTDLSGPLVAGLVAVAMPAGASPPAPPEELGAIPVALLVDIGSNQPLYARKPDVSFVPASMTKVMTAYVAFEEMAAGRLSPDRTITVRPETAQSWSGRGTSMYLQPGQKVSVHNLLRGIMTASANDGSVVLAEGYAGSVPAWSFLMNDAARRLGMTKSAYNTPSGWPDEGKTYVSARDLVKLARSMITRFPAEYRRYSGKTTFAWDGTTLRSHDPVTGVVPGADGIKTGYTREAGYNFLGSAERDGRRLVMVVAGARSEVERAAASRAFLEWGFAQWRKRPLFAEGQTVGRVRVQGGKAREVAVMAALPVHASVPVTQGDSQIRLSVHYRGPLVAPVREGQRVGELRIRIGDMPPGRVPLYAARSVDKAGPMDRLANAFMNLLQ